MHELVICNSAMSLYELHQIEDRSIRRKILNFEKKSKICLNRCIYAFSCTWRAYPCLFLKSKSLEHIWSL